VPLPKIEATLLGAHRTAIQADKLADVLIRVSLRARVRAGEAIAAARELLGPGELTLWLGRIGITPREAHRYHTFEVQRHGRPPRRQRLVSNDPPELQEVPISVPAAWRMLAALREALKSPDAAGRLEGIAKMADLVHVLYWDDLRLRATGLAIALEARSRIEKPRAAA